MIFGVGVDTVLINRVEKLWQRYGTKFANKVLHPKEAQNIQDWPRPGTYLAKGFAAREALVKAMGTGLSQGVVMRDIEIFHRHAGRPDIRLHGFCAEFAGRNNFAQIHLSLADEGGLVTAFVVIETVTG